MDGLLAVLTSNEGIHHAGLQRAGANQRHQGQYYMQYKKVEKLEWVKKSAPDKRVKKFAEVDFDKE